MLQRERPPGCRRVGACTVAFGPSTCSPSHTTRTVQEAAASYLERALSASRRLVDTACSASLAQALQGLAQAPGALGVGMQGLLHCWRAGHSRAAQQLEDGRWYVESCPAYVATVEGVTRWAARTAWTAAQAAVGWVEASVAEVTALGATLRRLRHGARRGGRHLLLEGWQVAALEQASGAEASTGDRQPLVVPCPPQVAELQHRSTVAMACPCHHDRHPSLVLWANGGAQCMVCRDGAGRAARWAWQVQGGQLLLYPAGQHTHTPRRSAAVAARHNKDPQNGPGAPVGGMVATRSTCTGYTTAQLAAYCDERGQWRLARSAGHRAAGDPLAVLRVAEQRSSGPAACERAQVVAVAGGDLPSQALLPTPLLSVSCMGRRIWAEPWQARVQRWVLIDLDDVQGLDRCGAQLGQQVAAAAAADPQASGRVAVVRTGPTGLQVWVELADARHSPVQWFQQPAVRRWHAALGCRLLEVVHGLGGLGGHADTSACAAGRYGRRPGWRLVGGQLYRAHLLHILQRGVCG